MAISDTINSLKEHIGNAYTAIGKKKGTVPANKNCENLKAAIESIAGGKEEQAKTVTIIENGTNKLLPDEGKTFSEVTVITDVPSKEEEAKEVDLAMASGNQTINPTSGKTLSQVVVKKPATMLPENIKKDVNIGGITGTLEPQTAPKLQTKTVTPTKSQQSVSPDSGYDGLSGVTVNAIPDNYVIPSGAVDITTNGTHNVSGKATANVNVPTGIDTSDATAIAADIRVGKTAYAKDAKLTGTIEDYDGAASQGSGNYTVKVIDYDGTVLMEKKGNTGDVIELPEAPTHDRLVFQKWSASRTVTDNKVTIGNDNVMVGATYTTASGQNEFDITVTKATGLTVTFNGSGVKDWGDGTSDSETSHTYTAYGDYMIKWAGSSVPRNVFGSGDIYFLTFARLAGITSIDSNAFRICHSLTSITIPDGVTRIDSDAFNGCHSLTSITIPDGVTSIRDSAFRECYSLTSITISKGVTSMNLGEFINCYSLISITIPDGVTSISGSAFNGCYSLISITIPDGVTSIGGFAFNDCYSLTSITIPDGVTRIDSNAFYRCYSLTSITIPDGVTRIDSNAFYSCYSLIKYDFSQATAVPTLSNVSAFQGINKICKIVVPDNLYDQWIAATNWSTYADYIYKASEVVS